MKINIVWHELRHIFRPGMLLLLFLFHTAFYLLFIQFHFDYFPNGRPALDEFKVHTEAVAAYGTRMDAQEFEAFKALYRGRVSEADLYIASEPRFAREGVAGYEQYRETGKPDFFELFRIVPEPDGSGSGYEAYTPEGNLFWELQARDYLIQRYEGWHAERSLSDSPDEDPLREKRKAVIMDYEEEGVLHSLFPGMVFDNFSQLAGYFAVSALIGIAFLLSPLWLRDRRNRLNDLQYSSAAGRSVYLCKLAAALLAAVLLFALQLAWLGYKYAGQGIGPFWETPVNSYFNSSLLWLNLTFGQYVALTLAAVFTLCLLAGLLSAVVSTFANNYAAVLACLIPVMLAFVLSGRRLMVSRLAELRILPALQPLLYAGSAAVMLLLIYAAWRRELGRDIA